MCGGEIEVSRCMLVGAVRAGGARPVFNVVHKDRSEWKRINESRNGDFNVSGASVYIIIFTIK